MKYYAVIPVKTFHALASAALSIQGQSVALHFAFTACSKFTKNYRKGDAKVFFLNFLVAYMHYLLRSLISTLKYYKYKYLHARPSYHVLRYRIRNLRSDYFGMTNNFN